MACTSRLIFRISVFLFVLNVIAGISYGIWYGINYAFNIGDHVHDIQFSYSNYKAKIIWQREDWMCRAEIYQGSPVEHEIDLGRWFTSNERGNGVELISGSGSFMTISVHEDSQIFTSIAFCTFYIDERCSYFNLNDFRWFCYSQAQNEIYRNLSVVTTEVGHTVDKLSDFQCFDSHTTS